VGWAWVHLLGSGSHRSAHITLHPDLNQMI
jgi:hypothetical protein